MTGKTYYHGGYGGLRRGDFILPPTETGAVSTASYGAGLVCRRDRVYVATSIEAAIMPAAMFPGKGKVYEVEPIGELVPDPDALMDDPESQFSFECERARIIRVVSVPGKRLKNVRRDLYREQGMGLAR